jgi:hypothetical protein
MAVVKLEIVADGSGAISVINKTGDAMQGLATKAKATEGALSSIMTGIGQGIGQQLYASLQSAAAGMANLVAGAVAAGGHLADMAAKTSIGAEALQRLQYAGSLAGVSLDDISGVVLKMQQNIGKGADGFKRLGLSLSSLKTMGADQQLDRVGKALMGIADPTVRAALAAETLGKGWASIAPMLVNGIGAAADRAQRLGLVMSGETVAGLDATGDAADTLMQALEGMGQNLGAAIASSPLVAQALDAIADAVGGLSRTIQDNQGAIQQLVNLLVIPAADVGVSLINAIGTVGSEIAVMSRSAAEFEKSHPWLVGAVKVGTGFNLLQGAYSMVKGASGLSEFGPKETTGSIRGTVKTPLTDAALAAAAKAQAEMLKLLGQSAAQAQGDMDKLADAVTKAGGVGALSASQLSHVSKEIDTLAANGAQAVGPLTMVAAQLAAINEEQLAHGMSFGPSRADMPVEHLGNMRAFGTFAQSDLTPGLLTAKDALTDIGMETVKTKAATVDWSQALQDVKNAFDLIGLGADSVLGRLAGIAASIPALAKNLKASFGNFKDMLAGGGLMKQLGAGLGLAGSALSLGATIFSGIKGLFHKPEWKGIGEDAGRVLGSVGEELAKQIQKTMKDLHVDVKTASLLNLDSAMASSGKAASTFAPQIMDLLHGIQAGSIPAKQGVESLGKAFVLLKDDAMAASRVGTAALASILQAARAGGGAGYTKEMRDFSAQQVGQAVDAMKSVMAGIAITSQASANAQGTIFASTFWAAVREQGLGSAIKSMSDSFGALQKKLQDAGMAMPALLGPVATLFNQMTPEVSTILDGITGLQQAFEGLSAAGYMTQQSFDAFGSTAVDAYNQATNAGLDQNAALVSVAPLLADIEKAHQQYGLVIDDNTQALIDQAAAAGIAFPADPIIAMTQAIQDLIATIREANNLPPINPVAGVPGGGGGGGGTGGGGSYTGDTPGYTRDIPKHAAGGYFTRPHVAMIAERGPEWVLNQRQMARLQGGGGNTFHIMQQPGESGEKLAQRVAALINNGGTTRRLMRAVGRA